ncbi:MAG: hypothetical protein GY801_36970 [bacterium]|nr:hypothetical protein [bacterium]
MKSKIFTMLVVLSMFLVPALCSPAAGETSAKIFAVDPAVVQGMTEFTSATEQFSLRYPADWAAEEDVKGGVLAIANTEAALDRFNAGQVQSGDFTLNVGFVPAMFFELIGGRLGATPQSLLQSIMPVMRARSENTAVSDIKVVSFAGEREAALVMVSDDRGEGAFMVFAAAEGVIAFMSAVGHPDEFEDFSDNALTVAATVEFNGDSEALWAAMLGAE